MTEDPRVEPSAPAPDGAGAQSSAEEVDTERSDDVEDATRTVRVRSRGGRAPVAAGDPDPAAEPLDVDPDDGSTVVVRRESRRRAAAAAASSGDDDDPITIVSGARARARAREARAAGADASRWDVGRTCELHAAGTGTGHRAPFAVRAARAPDPRRQCGHRVRPPPHRPPPCRDRERSCPADRSRRRRRARRPAERDVTPLPA